ncbi:hypothetical protein [Erysipelothrix larvae]
MKKVKALRFIFRNGQAWNVDLEFVGDLWIKQVTTSFGRINGGEFTEIYPCQSFKIEIFPEADAGQTTDINSGVLEIGMSNRADRYADIEMMDMIYDDDSINERRVYFPFKAQDADGNDNLYQSSKVTSDGRLFIVIDPEKTVDDIYPNV